MKRSSHRPFAMSAWLPAALVLLAAPAAPAAPDAGVATPAPAKLPPNAVYARIDKAITGGGFEMEGYWVWCPSVVKGDDGLFHMFASRWPKKLPFHPGWMVASEVVHATSATAEGPYKFSEVALPARGAGWWDGRSTHNPKILRHKGQWILFYMGSTHPFDDVADGSTLTLDSHYTTVARANKRIGVATAASPYGPWKRREAPVLDTKPGSYWSFLTSNPAPWINPDGSVVMLFKSRAYKDKYPYQTDMMISVATAPHFEGPYTVVPKQPIFGVGHGGEVEDPYLWRDKSGYHLLGKDQRGTITGEKHAGLLAHSKDALHWTIDKSPLAYSKTLTFTDGTVTTMGQLERPYALFDKGVMTHLFFATMDGPGGFKNASKSWDVVVRLKPTP